MLEEKSRSDTEGNLNESWFYNLGSVWVLCDGLKRASGINSSKPGTWMRSGFGIKGSFLELMFTCTLMSKGVLLSIALRVCGIPSNNWSWNCNWYFKIHTFDGLFLKISVSHRNLWGQLEAGGKKTNPLQCRSLTSKKSVEKKIKAPNQVEVLTLVTSLGTEHLISQQ